jgi:hypothetical protein
VTGVALLLRSCVAAGAAVALVGCSSGEDSASEPTAVTATGSADPSAVGEQQPYLDAVNALCDALLPEVVEATHGGSTDVPAQEWVATWPAHQALLDGFDADLARIDVPPSAAEPARVIAAYVVWATGIDEARIAAAQQGEDAWRSELAAEADLTSAPELLALGPAGFHDSCQAR